MFLLVANQISGNVVVFKRNVRTGLLTKTGIEVKMPGPSCLQIRTYND
jgi:6-phosphogluconolactonase (cycloisomerase 2 family)